MRHIFLYFILFILPFFLAAQNDYIHELEDSIYTLNNAFKYGESQALIQTFLNEEKRSNEDKYFAYLYLSYTYKRLFDYSSTLKNLDKALSYGILTPKKDYFIANIHSQKALALFDIHRYEEADSLMKLLAKNQYQHLNEEYQAKIIMQEAYLHYMKKEYVLAEKKYDKAISLMQIASPCDLPMIYAKKIELYGEMTNDSAMYHTYNLSLQCSDSCKIVKYKMYTKEMMGFSLEKRRNYAEAISVIREYDTLYTQYNSNEHLIALNDLDKKYQTSLKDYQLAVQRRQVFFLGAIIFLLILSLILLAYFYITLKKQKNIINHQNEMNEKMISILSHDIKDPLLGIQLLLKKLKIKDPFLTQASQSLEKQVISLNQVLNNLLKVKAVNRQIENGLSSKQDIINLLNNIMQNLEAKYSFKNIDIILDLEENTPITLPISPEKLQIILQSLINNAIKYSYPNGKISIFIRENSIYIRDFGIGISKDNAALLLKEVVNAQKGTNDEKGNGIGLYLVGELIKGSKMKVSFESPKEGGTLVKIGEE